MEISTRIKEMRKELRISQAELAKKAGITQPSLSAIERGTAKNIRATTLKGIANALGVSQKYLESGDKDEQQISPVYNNYYSGNVNTVNTKKVPVISMVAAGDWSECFDPYPVGNGSEYVDCDKCGDNAFAVKVVGESMAPRFQRGDIIICDPSVQPANKDLVIAKLPNSNEATFKQLIIEDGAHLLKALNPDWPSPIMAINDDCVIIGKVIKVVVDL